METLAPLSNKSLFVDTCSNCLKGDVPPAVKVKALDLAARLAGMFNATQVEVPLSAAHIEGELRR